MGGGPTSLLATVVAPLWGGHGPMGRLHWPGVAIASPVGTLVGSPLVGPEAQWPPWGGNTLSRGVAGGVVHISPPVPPRLVLPRVAPPDARGPLEVLVGIVLGEHDSSTPRV